MDGKGRISYVSARVKRMLIRRACSKKQIWREIKREFNLWCSSRAVGNVLQKEKNISFRKLISRPPFAKVRKRPRVQFAKNYITFVKILDDVIFSDGKKLDGPNGFRYF